MVPRILVADDDEPFRDSVCGLLRTAKYDVLQAASGREALETATTADVDLVLLDLQLPDLDGIGVLKGIRAAGSWVPVIVLTGYGDRLSRRRGLEEGADDFLEKPFDSPVLLARVRNLLWLRDSLRLLNDRNDTLERLQARHRELAEALSSELKGPLATLEAALAVLARQPGLSPEASVALDQAAVAARRAAGYVGDALAIAGQDATSGPQPADLAVLLEETAALRRGEAAGRRIGLAVRAEGALRVRGDAVLLRRVVESLVDHAVARSPDGGKVELAARAEGDSVRLVVADSGAPLATADRLLVFERGARGDDGDAAPGLRFCRRAVERLGGSIEATRLPGWPDAVVVRLPV